MQTWGNSEAYAEFFLTGQKGLETDPFWFVSVDRCFCPAHSGSSSVPKEQMYNNLH